MASVTLQGITQRFDRANGNAQSVVAIDNISFTVPDGAFWVLVGPSGCGKSTLLRTIAGLEAVQTGQLFIGERLMNDIPARQRDVAMVFQNYALYPHMTVAENLGFGLKMRGQTVAQIQEQVQRVARSLAIEHLLDRKPKQLSGGQQQRVALGRALARQPQVFLLDEPLSNLDAQLRDRTRTEIKQLHQEWGITTIYVTHDQTEAMTLADTIVLLDRGIVQQIGSPSQLYQQPHNRLVATFIGSPPMNILPVTINSEGGAIAAQQFSWPTNWSLPPGIAVGQHLDLGIRPEHCRLSESGTAPLQLTVVVDVLENLGREILVQGHLPDTCSVVNCFAAPHATHLQPGDRVTVTLDPQQLHYFAAATGQRLS